jgi:hypothetical protein
MRTHGLVSHTNSEALCRSVTRENTKIPRGMQLVRSVQVGILSLGALLPATASAMQAKPVSLRLLAARAQPVKKAHTGETVNSSARSIL